MISFDQARVKDQVVRSQFSQCLPQLIAQKSQQELCFASKWRSTKGFGTLIESFQTTLKDTLSPLFYRDHHGSRTILSRIGAFIEKCQVEKSEKKQRGAKELQVLR